MFYKELIIEGIGLVLFCADQISDIIILVQGDFYNQFIAIFMYLFFSLNMLIVFVMFAAKNIAYMNYFIFKLSREESYQRKLFISDKIYQILSFYWLFLWNGIAAIFWYIILTIIQMLVLWFGFYKLYNVHHKIQAILNNFLFLAEQNEGKTQNSEQLIQQMKNMSLKLDLIEKIFENIPQLILQIINIQMQDGEFTKIQIISIGLAILDIIYNIILAFTYKFEVFKQNVEKITTAVKKILKYLPYLQILQIIQIVFYIIITISYSWVDYKEFKDIETHGKDLHDSIRTFIIIFPFAFLSNIFITTCCQCSKERINLQTSDIILITPLILKNAVIVQMCFDLLVFSAPPFEYGQSIMKGQENMNIFLIIIIISQFAETGLFYWRIIENEIYNAYILVIAYFIGIICIILEIKFFSHWVNLAYYYDWTDLDIKQTITIDSSEQCNDDLERTIRGYIITFLVFWIGKYVTLVLFELSFERKFIRKVFFVLIFLLFSICNWVISICYLSYRAENKFCDDLQFVQKKDKALLIIHVIIQPFIVVFFAKKLKQAIDKY